MVAAVAAVVAWVAVMATVAAVVAWVAVMATVAAGVAWVVRAVMKVGWGGRASRGEQVVMAVRDSVGMDSSCSMLSPQICSPR